jgi:NDP-sugar pyrophosphorylase family protein
MPQIRQAFVLGAGLGTRLRPLTEQLPKPLVPIFQKPLITFALDHLIDAGCEKFCVNTHHQPQHFDATFPQNEYRGVPISFRHEPVLLETGGGVKNVEDLLGEEPFIVYSGDILTDIDLRPLIDEHFAQGNDVTLALRETGLARGVAFRDGRVLDIGGKLGEAGTHDFANVSIWNRQVFTRIPAATKISFVPILVQWIAEGGRIGGVVLSERKWFNIGSRNSYIDVHRTILSGWSPHYMKGHEWPQQVASDAQIAPDAQLRGCTCIGAGAMVGAGAMLEDTIVWRGAQIASRSDLRNCIVRADQKADGTLRDTDI